MSKALFDDYVAFLKQHGLQISMSRKGNCWDNAFAETFFKTLKQEEVWLNDYETYEDVLANIPRFIEDTYNKKRFHSSLGYQSPEEFENSLLHKTNIKSANHPVLKLW